MPTSRRSGAGRDAARSRKARYEDAGLLVTLRSVGEKGNGGLEAMEMIVVPPRAKDEIGYRGYVQCYQ